MNKHLSHTYPFSKRLAISVAFLAVACRLETSPVYLNDDVTSVAGSSSRSSTDANSAGDGPGPYGWAGSGNAPDLIAGAPQRGLAGAAGTLVFADQTTTPSLLENCPIEAVVADQSEGSVQYISLAADGAVEQTQNRMVGFWRGVAKAPWDPNAWIVDFIFLEDGSYVADTGFSVSAFYFGSDSCYPAGWRLDAPTDLGVSGTVDVYTLDNLQLGCQFGWRGVLKSIEADASGKHLRFDYFRGDDAGIHYTLMRCKY